MGGSLGAADRTAPTLGRESVTGVRRPARGQTKNGRTIVREVGALALDSETGKADRAITQWRDSLLNLSGRNRLLNYRPTRSSTIEYSRHSAAEVFELIAAESLTFTLGTRADERNARSVADEEELATSDVEGAVLEQLREFDFEQHPGHLFTDKTQRDVDRALRNLAAASKREFIDKGLRILYVALGELRWVDGAGDIRRSPLLLVPAELAAPGPRERTYVRFSDDDFAVNPALSLLLAQEYGIELPSADDLEAELEADGVQAVLNHLASMNWPDGWEVHDFAALAAFMFAKEAMYRDLLDNADAVANSDLVRALSGAIPAEQSEFVFDPAGDDVIDVVAPPETTPLVLDADASQRAAIHAAVAGKSFTLDGPPGTGKSQTIANIIGALIAAGRSVLFVSEKAVALDVVRNRLTDRGLGAFLFELHSSKAVRKDVARRLGDALGATPVPPAGMSAVKLGQLEQARRDLSDYAEAANEIRRPLDATFHDILGRLERDRTDQVGPPRGGNGAGLTAQELDAVERAAAGLQRNWRIAEQGRHATWYGLVGGGTDLAYPLQRLTRAIERLRPVVDSTRELREAFGAGAPHELNGIATLLDVWFEAPVFLEQPWLDEALLKQIENALAGYEGTTSDLQRVEQDLTALVGDQWPRLEPIPEDRIPEASLLAGLPGITSKSTSSDLDAARRDVEDHARALRSLEQDAQALARGTGAYPPSNLAETRMLLDALQHLLDPHPPLSNWLYDKPLALAARAAAERLRNAQQRLVAAEREASPHFNAAALTADLDALEHLAAEQASFAKRFGAGHKALREALATISPAAWKDAVAALPRARSWADAWSAYRSAFDEARTSIGDDVDPNQAIDWELIDRRFLNLHALTDIPFVDEPQTRLATGDPVHRHELAALADRLGDDLRHWHSTVSDVRKSFVEVAAELEEQLRRLRPVLEFVALQADVLGPNASIDRHMHAARLRVQLESAAAAAARSWNDVRTTASEDSITGTLLEPEPAAIRRHIHWARRLLDAATTVPNLRRLESAQINLLRRTHPHIDIKGVADEYQQASEGLFDKFDQPRRDELRRAFADLDYAAESVARLRADLDGVDAWFDLQRSMSKLESHGLGASVQHALAEDLPKASVAAFLTEAVLRGWIESQIQSDPRLAAGSGADRDELVAQFRELDSELAKTAVTRIVESASARRPRSASGQAAIIRREAEKKRKHIAVRELIGQTKDVVLALHPCFMMSPLAVSLYLPAEQLFDVVIFDEASQVLPGDAINCVYRGAALIAAGDQKQLPPTSFFEANADDGDEDGDEDLANDFESILDLMKSSGAFTAQSLRWHYRSRHEHLIAYSNASFYDSRLVTFPGAVAESADAGVRYFKVNGVYRRSAGRDNPIEARHVAERVMHHYTTRPNKSLGVVAFSTAQRDAIEAAVELARSNRPDLDAHFDEDRVSGFFVKSLESVQGDERDVIIFSTGYGPDEHGKIYRQFGPVGRAGGERRLNVAITRAKELVEVVTSMSAGDIGEATSAGTRHLRRYLDFAERGPSALAMELSPSGLDTESPFEDAVVDFIRGLGFEVQPQVGVSSYRIDIGVKHPNQPGAFMIGVECDGAMYHSSRAARDRDRLRHQILEGLGWNLHHIWGTAWYRHPDREKERLRQILERLAAQPVLGRVVAETPQAAAPVVVDVVETRLDATPDWVSEYEMGRTTRVPSVDLSDPLNAPALIPFVQAIAGVEAPLHMDVLAQRLREHSDYGRIGSRIRGTLILAVRQAGLATDGVFVRNGRDDTAVVRSGGAFVRSVDQIPDDELGRALELLTQDAVVITEDALVTQAAALFGWKRIGGDIRTRLLGIILALLRERRLEETDGGLKRGQAASPDTRR
ncbi:DUF3320 domain-containing protein [Curtobacterium flaccumfaciens pv. flaccumfaciens]|uniref:DUF3320 domain-containing protein n=1 Tax=Curtobacterium flaccumfaciens TaxID=2035 RepID=UPI00265871F3|nr:DUF3320 domain-containing protein [Curtobacterium flaccumfaciens]MCS5510053.1 DUF3320 domain-containing protein [Curtobacterium flaccumfaciens pv. flaccumfaciens]